MTKHITFQSVISTVIFVFLGICGNQLNAQESVSICARYVDGFGSNHGWHDVDNAEGCTDDDSAWKYLDTDYYGRLLKAYDFEQWSQTFPIVSVSVTVFLDVYDPNCDCANASYEDVEIRVYNGTNVIVSKIEPIACCYPDMDPFITVVVPQPNGGWTKDKVDSLQVWIGAKERKSLYLNIDDIVLVAHSYNLISKLRHEVGSN